MMSSFTQKIKLELLNQEFNAKEALTFLAGLVSAAAIREKTTYIIKLNRENIGSLIKDIMQQLMLEITESTTNHNWIIVEQATIPPFDGKFPAFYFAGVFLGGGSISDPGTTSYHLEIQLYDRNEAQFIQKYLNQYNFHFSLIRRRNNWVLYIKKAEQISDFLKAIQAIQALMAFENSRILRDYHNNLNRMSNLDVYNQKKLVLTSRMYQKFFLEIKTHNLTDHFRAQELRFFELKRLHPTLSLHELTKLYEQKTGIYKTKSGLNHWLRKLKRIYDENILSASF